MNNEIIIDYLIEKINELSLENLTKKSHISFLGFECGQTIDSFDKYWGEEKKCAYDESNKRYDFDSELSHLNYKYMSIKCHCTPQTNIIYHLHIMRHGGSVGVKEAWDDYQKLEELFETKYGKAIYEQDKWSHNKFLPDFLEEYDLPKEYEDIKEHIRIYECNLGRIVLTQDSQWRCMSIHYIDKVSYDLYKMEHKLMDLSNLDKL